MTDIIIDLIKEDISALHWIDRYAGLVVPATRHIPKKNEFGFEDFNTEIFPVAINVDNTRCWENGLYKDLVPDSKYKSVAYWEDISGLQKVGVRTLSKRREIHYYQASLRFVCWVNMKLAGYAPGESISPLQIDVINTLNEINIMGIENPIKIITLRMNVSDILPKDHKAVFGNYSYANDFKLFMYPYDYFALNVKAQLTMDHDCVISSSAKSPIVC